MKREYSHIGLAKLCGWFGITRQAYYQSSWRAMDAGIESHLVLSAVRTIRINHPRIGTRKLYEMIKPFMIDHQIKMGRDALFNLLSINNLLVRRRQRRISTTNSYHRFRKYPNLIRGYEATRPEQLWVSDITYWKIKKGHVYISLITDAYSHKIVGYQVAESLATMESLKALRMALKTKGKQSMNLIHHSDRGIQYCSKSYVKLLQDYEVRISMTENGDPLENAVAERINGILKHEYLENYEARNIKEAKAILKANVELYNNERPHMSISNFTPNYVHSAQGDIKLTKLWKNYYQKKPDIGNQCQDLETIVNVLQD